MSGSHVGAAGVIGWPVAHSKSPLIHRFWLEKLGLDGDYSRFPVEPAALGSALHALGSLGLRGVNLTVPHKQAALPHLDALDPSAREAGAANVVVVDADGKLTGYNTDGLGFLEPLRPYLAQPSLFRMARLFGTGGAAAGIARALAAAGLTLVVVGRDRQKADALIADLPGEHHAADLAHFADPTDFAFDDRSGVLDLVINATTLGMAGQPPLPLDWSHVPPGSVVYDIVYAPRETPLLAEARRRGHRTIEGLAMLVGQAAPAFRLFFGVPAPREHDAELFALLER